MRRLYNARHRYGLREWDSNPPGMLRQPEVPPATGGEARLDFVTNDVHITPEGLETVRKELDQLTTERRPAIVAKIKAAREFGDLSENFEYHAAKNEQGFMEARIKELESIIKNHVLIETTKNSGVVSMGSTMRFSEDEASDEVYRTVAPPDADPQVGTLRYESALGKALL
ncbi:MAG: transcription elongation factor GreA, partial [Candidatus Dormibacteraeota bacterium]|nr:transcription elongation factor GreA [Candidatus Dormibacteraeota bacterium]